MINLHSIRTLFFALVVVCACQVVHARTVLDVASLATDPDISTSKARAEKIAQIAERFAQTYDFIYADRVVDIALDLDEENFRAQLLRRYIDIVLQFKGMTYRMSGIVPRMSKEDRDKYAEQVKAERKDPRLKRFLHDRKLAPFQTGEDLKAFFRAAITKIDRTAEFIKENEDKVISITSAVRTFSGSNGAYFHECQPIEVSPNVFVIETCLGWDKPSVTKISKYDWQAIRLDLIQTKWSLTLLLAYSFDGLEDIVVGISNMPREKISIKNLAAEISKSANFGKLVGRDSLKELVDLGHEATFIVRQLMQTDSCRSGTPKARKGQYFSNTRCFKFEFPFIGPRFGESLNGPVEASINLARQFAFSGAQNNKPYVTQIDMRKILDGDVVSLQALLPDQFDSCGRPLGFREPTIYGLFPRGDFFQVADQFRGIEHENEPLVKRCVRN